MPAATIAGTFGLAFILYSATAATTYTWAHNGEDGGDLLAAAVTNGVPHPSGYPLYTILLQAALAFGKTFAPDWEPARAGNLFSSLVAALAASVTTWTAGRCLNRYMPTRQPLHVWGVAGLAGLAFAAAPLQWSQALITEVYALHSLWIAALGWLTFSARLLPWRIALIAGFGLAHHPTFALILPAALYGQWRQTRAIYPLTASLLAAAAIAMLFYLRIPWAARINSPSPAPVLWGYPDNWQGFWWLISGAAYHEFVFGVPVAQLPGRGLAALELLVRQYTALGAFIIFIGLQQLHRRGRDFGPRALLWAIPTLLYTMAYNTTDSYTYLLPLVWLSAIALAAGLYTLLHRIWEMRPGQHKRALAVAALLLLVLVAWRVPSLNLRGDTEARRYIDAVVAGVTPGSLLLTGTDAHTFALWYATWGTEELTTHAPGTAVLNAELYSHAWYQRLIGDLYPDLLGIGLPLPEFIQLNAAQRSVWLTEPLADRLSGSGEAQGILWRYYPAE